MNFVEGCAQCERLAAQYEAATLEWFRVQSQLGVAEFLRDKATSTRIVDELAAIARRRNALRESAAEHFAKQHAVLLVGSSN